ncbi:hypothetical protein P3T37_005381 [Kitasatospora sp. MAA4]|uniref:hypothetical protein n=1 Tax=Kitasatospora sp. MAA4 TaxID=3035093 RepID=UPI00247625A9|nr:hypothetical protein [Kitasatospora sp. MAA4]MDH6135962.1 hypothetical protein [Kitasatospora sp. MAA4]
MSSLDHVPQPDGGGHVGETVESPLPDTGWHRLSAALDGRRWVWPALLALGYLAQLAVRLLLARPQSFPAVIPDEPSYLVLARALGGGPVTEIPVGHLLPAGYPLLAAPALAVTDSAGTGYHLVLLTNALVTALVLPLGFLLLRRLRVPALPAYGFATAAGLLSPVLFYGQFAMTDSVLAVVLLGWLLALHGLLAEGTLRRRTLSGVLLGLLTGYAYSLHDRGSVVIVITALLLLGVLALKWAPRRATLAALAALAVAAAGVQLVNAYLAAKFPGSTAGDVNSLFFDSLTNPHLLGRTVARSFGQTWYFVLSSFGLGGLGIVSCVLALFRPALPRAARVSAGALLAVLFGIIVASAVTLPDDGRIDDYVYARYAAPLVAPMFLVGAAGLCLLGVRALLLRAGAVVLLVALCAGVVTELAGRKLRTGGFELWGLPDVSFLAGHWTSLRVFRSTAVGLAILVAVVLLTVLARRALPLLAVALSALALVSSLVITQHVVRPYVAAHESDAVRMTRTGQVRPDDKLVMDQNLGWPIQAGQMYEVNLGRVWTENLYGGQLPPAGATVAVLPVDWHNPSPQASWPHAPAGWSVVVDDHAHGYVVWRPTN